jgi:hypothetical protein
MSESEKVDIRDRVAFVLPWAINTVAMIATAYVYDCVLRPAAPGLPALNTWGWVYIALMVNIMGMKPCPR